jgi:hypothetical protein
MIFCSLEMVLHAYTNLISYPRIYLIAEDMYLSKRWLHLYTRLDTSLISHVNKNLCPYRRAGFVSLSCYLAELVVMILGRTNWLLIHFCGVYSFLAGSSRSQYHGVPYHDGEGFA